MLRYFLSCLTLVIIVAPLVSLGLHTQASKYRCRRTRAVALILDFYALLALVTFILLQMEQ